MSEPERIALLCPSRGRPQGCRRLVESALGTSDPHLVRVYVYCDASEQEEYAAALTARAFLIRGRRRTAVEGWNYLAEEALEDGADIIAHVDDDMAFTHAGWDQIVRATFAKYPDRIVHAWPFDGKQPFGTCGFVHRRWVDTVGYFVPPGFVGDYIDLWLDALANECGRNVQLPFDIAHYHPTHGHATHDATYDVRRAEEEEHGTAQLWEQTAARRLVDAERLRATIATFGPVAA